MRRVIKGKLYDTKTATLVARDTYVTDDGDTEETLYKTQGGVFFLITANLDEDRNSVEKETWRPISRKAAEEWFNAGEAIELYDESIFSAPDEASLEDEQEKMISMTVRVPSELRDSIAKAASKENLSMNAFMARCAKRCLELGTGA